MTRRQPAVRSYICSVFFLTIVSGLLILLPQGSSAQLADSTRKVLERTPAPYPTLARTMAFQAMVKLEVLVSPDGR